MPYHNHSKPLIPYLGYLVSDDPALCQNANDRGSLEKLADLVKLITPLGKPSEWDEDEPESISCLREVSTIVPCLT